MNNPLQEAGRKYAELRRQEAKNKLAATVQSLGASMTNLELQVSGNGGRKNTDEAIVLKNAIIRTIGKIGSVNLEVPEELKVDEILLPGGRRVVITEDEKPDRVVVDMPEMRRRVNVVRGEYKKKKV